MSGPDTKKTPLHDVHVGLGATITDLLRTFRQRPYAPEQHIRRFYESAKYARLTVPLAPEQTAEAIRHLVSVNSQLLPPGGELAIVLFLTPGENLVYAGSASGGAAALHPTFCIHSFPLPFRVTSNDDSPGVACAPSASAREPVRARRHIRAAISRSSGPIADVYIAVVLMSACPSHLCTRVSGTLAWIALTPKPCLKPFGLA